MAARCRDCGQYVRVADPTARHDHTCSRCAALEDYYGALDNVRDGCEASVESDTWGVDVCGRPVYGVRVDPEYQELYAVCRRHYRPPFERCLFAGDWRHCDQHGGTRFDGEDYCDAALSDPAPAGEVTSSSSRPAGATKHEGTQQI